MKCINKIILLLCIFFVFIGCEDDEITNIYGNEVFFQINATAGGPDHILNTYGQYKVFTENRLASDRGVGLGGLLVVCSHELIQGTTFYHLYAYDLACPVERSSKIRVEPDKDGHATCPKCGSVYSLFGGDVVSGKSTSKLQRYYAEPNRQTPGIFVVRRR